MLNLFDDSHLVEPIIRLYKVYQNRYYQAHRREMRIYNPRSKPLKDGKHYTTFVNIFKWCLGMGINTEDYIEVTVPWLVPGQRGPKYLNTYTCRQSYLDYRAHKDINLCRHDAQTSFDLIRNDIILSLQLIEQNKRLFGHDYELLLTMSAEGLSPYFLATDSVYLRLVRERKISEDGGHLRVLVVLGQFTEDDRFYKAVIDVRNEQLRNLSQA